MKISLKKITFFIILILIISCNNLSKKEKTEQIEEKHTQKKYQEIIPNKIVYDFINNALLKENKIYQACENLLDRNSFIDIEGDSLLISNLDSLFSKEDKEFIKAQYLNSNKFVLNQKFIKEKNLIKLDTTLNSREDTQKYWRKIEENYNCVGFIRVPIFNKRKNIVIIEVSYNCGSFCGEGGTFIYKLNKENNWELIMTLEKWVS